MKKTMALVVGMMMAASLAGCGAKNESKTVDDIKKAGKLVICLLYTSPSPGYRCCVGSV